LNGVTSAVYVPSKVSRDIRTHFFLRRPAARKCLVALIDDAFADALRVDLRGDRRAKPDVILTIRLELTRRVELAERQRDKLAQQLERQSRETEEVRQAIVRMQQRCDEAKSRLQLLQAQMRQVEARKAIGGVLACVAGHNLHGEFERISARVEEEAATERNYQKLDDELSGEDIRRRFEADAVADAVEDRLARMRQGGETA